MRTVRKEGLYIAGNRKNSFVRYNRQGAMVLMFTAIGKLRLCPQNRRWMMTWLCMSYLINCHSNRFSVTKMDIF